MPPVPDDNPYSAPQAAAVPVVVVGEDRLLALWRVRWALVILAVPAAVNYVCLHLVYAPHRMARGFVFSSRMHVLFAVLNFVASLLTMLGAWYFGLIVFESASAAAHHAFGGRLPKDEWLTAMYRALWRLPWAAGLGAALWLAWCYLYFVDYHFPVWLINLVLGGVGHLVAAWVYVSVLLSWYRLRRDSNSSGAAS